MLHIDELPKQALPSKRPTDNGVEEPASAKVGANFRLWQSVKRYPLPFGSLALLLASFSLWLAGRADLAQWMLLAIILLGGIPLLWETGHQLLRREFSVDLIAILAIGGSLLLGQYLAGAFVVLMLSGGEALEAYALRRARSSLAALAERAPRTAHIWQDAQLTNIPAEAVEIGMQVVVKPGELIPVDGTVAQGSSSVSEADLTGEPLPVRKEPGAIVFSGSVNLDSLLEICATRRSAESQYAQIVRLVEEAQKQKAPIHRLADRYGVWFTVFSILLAAAAWALSGDSIYALSVLVVATPCPLILATPIAIMSGINRAAHKGMIVKSGATIEQLGAVKVAVFDKTGTLTLGTPRLVGMFQPQKQGDGEEGSYSEDTLLQLVASVEQFSTHILARAAVTAAQERGLLLIPASNFEEVAGKGIRGCVRMPDKGQEHGDEGSFVEIAIGNRTFMRSLAIELPLLLLAEREQRTAQGQIVSFIALDRKIVGLLIFADIPRPELTRLSAELKDAGVQETILLTGDGETVAQQIGAIAKVDRVIARCLPEEKVRVVRELEAKGHRVLMVGDGINDAPALATATVGVAIGAQGLTAAAAAADSVLLSTDILQVVGAVRLGRRVMRVATQGIWIGMGLSIVAMIFAFFGFIPPAAGAILQEGIDVIVILNALRAGRA